MDRVTCELSTRKMVGASKVFEKSSLKFLFKKSVIFLDYHFYKFLTFLKIFSGTKEYNFLLEAQAGLKVFEKFPICL